MYEKILKAFLQDVTLSLDEKGLLCFMVSHHPTFQFHLSWLALNCGCSRNKCNRIIQQLKAKGYISLVVEKGANKLISNKYFKVNRDKIIHSYS